MANICNNSVVFYGLEQEELYKAILKLRVLNINSGSNGVGLDDILTKFHAAHGTHDIGTLEGVRISPSVKTHKITGLRLEIDSKWEPPVSFFDSFIEALATEYNKSRDVMDYVFVAEEPGNEVYINTDLDHMFFVDKLHISCHDEYDDWTDEYFSYDEPEYAAKYILEKTGYKVAANWDEIEEHAKEIEEEYEKKHKDADTNVWIQFDFYTDY